jgi:NAD(P)-dependent dehydrogenase (short-subunit alcohol dehydrogenase family)
MGALSGKRAVVTEGAYAADLVAALRAHDADVARLQAPDGLDEGIDIVVTCPSLATQHPGGDFDTILASVAAAERWTTAATRSMSARNSGAIVHVTGLSGLGGWPGWQASGAAFAAIHNLVRSHAVSLAPQGVRINALVPGVDAKMARTIAEAEGVALDTLRARIPLGRFMDAQALANALVYLVHGSASYVTGEVLAVDGGWDMWGRLYAVAPK